MLARAPVVTAMLGRMMKTRGEGRGDRLGGMRRRAQATSTKVLPTRQVGMGMIPTVGTTKLKRVVLYWYGRTAAGLREAYDIRYPSLGHVHRNTEAGRSIKSAFSNFN